jgi:phenylalanyl-tRNA synthetase beta chain
MRVVYSWLKDFIDIDIPVIELADALTAAGLEVASIEQYKIPAGIKVVKILETQKHPNADKLSICKVDAGLDEPLTIVCGAPNVKAGMLSPLATLGTVLGADFTVKKAKIRGVESSGMLCSEQELGLSNSHDGIMDLPADFKVGEELSSYYCNDAVIEIEITPDRGDCLSMLGVAREVSARFGLPLKSTAKQPLESGDISINDAITVHLDAPALCPHYTGRLIRGIKIAPSPHWLQRRLTLAGIRPINNVVDVTNYILLQYGQPMHAFDYNSIQGKKIFAKKADKVLTFITLDNIERKLVSDDLLICDANRAVALAGIMGGAGSEILDTTTDVFLESAFFDPIGVRKTSKRLGLSTDSSYRFERGVDPDSGLIDAVDTAAELIRTLAGGTVAKGRIDQYPQKFTPCTIKIRASRTSKLLGIPFTIDQIESYLSSLGMGCTRESSDTLSCIIPLYRHDITIEADLIEEIGRMFGYDNIPPSEVAPVSLKMPLPIIERITDKLRSALTFFGLNELVTNSMTSEHRRAVLTPEKKPVVLLNPLNPEMAQMRTTLAGNMLEVLSYNLNRKNSNNHFFEIGKVFESTDSGFQERHILSVLIEGNYWASNWNSAAQPCDFYVLKGLLETFAAHTGIGAFSFSKDISSQSILENEVAHIEGTLVHGIAGKISRKAGEFFDIKSSVYYAELDITTLLESSLPQPHYRSLPKFPALERDFCFVMAEELSSSAITDEIFLLSPLVEAVVPFDLFRGDKLGAGRKSIAFSVKLRSAEKTLTDKEVEGICTAIVTTVQSKFGAQLRT